MRGRTRNARWLAAAFAAATTIGLTGVSLPAMAVPVTNSNSAVLDDAGDPASSVTTGAVVTYRTNAPITVAGSSDQTVTQTFDPSRAAVRGVTVDSTTLPDVTAPEGYTLEYRYGSPAAWSATPPAYDATSNTYPTLTGVRATGSLTVSSGDATLMTQTVVSSDTAVSVASPTISGSGGGDGWDVFFGGTSRDRVFNIWHHAAADGYSPSTLYLDCHKKKTGEGCWSFGAFQSTGAYYTPWQSTGYYKASTDSVWTFVGRNTPTNSFGMACIKDVSTASPSDCDTPFVALATPAWGISGAWGSAGTGESARVGDRIFARAAKSGEDMLCFDLSTELPCTSQPYSIGSPTGVNNGASNRLLAMGTRVIFSTGNTLGCFDTTTNALCSGFAGGSGTTTYAAGALYPVTDSDGAPTKVCAYGTNYANSSTGCWSLDDGTATTPATNMPFVYSSITDGWGIPLNVGAKLYYLSAGASSPYATTVQCWDYATAAACTNFTAPSIGNYGYAITADPVDPTCLWTNSDQGRIITLDARTGASPCGVGRAAVDLSPATLPRLSCATGRVQTWATLTVTGLPTGESSLGNARITVLDSDRYPITGWSDLAVNGTTGELDLSTLTLASTGDSPRFVVAFTDAVDAVGTTIDVTYASPAPQLCTNLIAGANPCPAGIGVGTASFPYTATLGVASTVSIATTGAATTTEDTSDSADFETLQAAQCLVPASGYVYWQTDGTPPVAGLTVYLYGPDGTTVLATAVTDANGYYSFSGLYPETYQVGTSSGGTGSGYVTPATELCPPDGDCSHELDDLFIPAMTAQLTHTTETCSSVFLSGTAADLTDLYYTVSKKGTRSYVNSTAPGVFFYWAKVTVSNGVVVSQSANPSFPLFTQAAGSNVYNLNCAVVKGAKLSTTGGVTSVSGLSGSGTYLVSVKLSTSVVNNQPVPAQPVIYSFTSNGGAKALTLRLSPKP